MFAKLSIGVVFAFAILSATATSGGVKGWLVFCGTALDVTVVGEAELKVVGVGLLLIKLSTKADVTLGEKIEEKVFASGGTIGMKGIGCGGLTLGFCG